MLIDSLSLKLIQIYVKQFHANEGDVSDIVVSREILHSEFKNSPTRYSTYKDFESFFSKIDKEVNFEKVNTELISIYRLKSFNVRKRGGLFNVSNGRKDKFITNGPVSKILINTLNTKYIEIYDEVHRLFHVLKMNEYILTSDMNNPGGMDEYIEYGYIEKYFSNAVEELKQLYRKYKNK